MAISRLASNAAFHAGRAQRAFLAQGVLAARSAVSLTIDAARENSRISSYPQVTGGQILTAVDVGGTHAKVQVANHKRVYPVQGQLDVADVNLAGIADVTTLDDGVTAIANATDVYLYYDDATLSAAAPVVKATTDPKVAQVGYAPDRHFLGKVTTPAAGDGPARGDAGLPPGSKYSA